MKDGHKVILVLILILQLIIMMFLGFNYWQSHKPQYIYKTMIIELNNTNFGERIDVVDYVCDEGVYVYKTKSSNYFYASTWEGDSSMEGLPGVYGKCMIKFREEVHK